MRSNTRNVNGKDQMPVYSRSKRVTATMHSISSKVRGCLPGPPLLPLLLAILLISTSSLMIVGGNYMFENQCYSLLIPNVAKL